MIPVFIDLETYYSPTHSLTKMSPLAYCMHPDTEVISIAIKVGKYPTDVIFGEDKVKHALSRIDWSNKMVIGHNLSGFDGMILAWRLGVRPKAWGCTLAMARPFFAKTVGVSLKAVAKELGLGDKLDFDAVNAKGKHLCDFTPEELAKMEAYNRTDTELCAGIFNALAPKLGVKELNLIDMTIRMLLEPTFVLDYDMLEDALVAEKRRKFEALMRIKDMLGVEDEEAARTMLASAPKFKAFLESQGVPVPMKISKTTEKPTPALAKTDEDFLALLEHDNELVAAAAEARLGVKSTILETRIEAFIAAGDAVNGLLPVPLHWAGADTTWRWSGWAYNPQNLPRIDPSRPKPGDALRKSMRAPKGYKVIVADLSGIELRVNHFLWQVPSSMQLYQQSPDKADLYKEFASNLYVVPLSEVSKQQRQVGKVAQLGLGFGASAATFVKIAKLMGGVDMTLDEAKTVVFKWRQAYREIAQGWRTCHESLEFVHDGRERAIDPWGLCLTCKQGIILNTGHNHIIRYPGLHEEVSDDNKAEWWYGQGRKRARIYAGKVDENLVQALARDVIADSALEFKKRTGLLPKLMVHDELVYVVPERHAEPMLAELQAIMRTPPTWWPELVTWSEGDIADTYGAAK